MKLRKNRKGINLPIIVLIILSLLASIVYAEPDSDQLKQKIQSFSGTLKLVDAEYKDAVNDGKIIDDKEYLETEIFLDKATEIYAEISDDVAKKSQETQKDVSYRLDTVRGIVSEKGDPAIVSENIQTIIVALQGLTGAGTVSDEAKGEANQQNIADSELAGEQLAGELRIGVIIESAKDFWIWENGKLIQEPSSGKTHHFGVVLREKTTKRMIPYTEINVTIKREDGWFETKKLYPLWGELFHYGNNVNFLKDGNYEATLNIQHGWELAHEDMVNWIKPIVAVFEFSVENGTAKLKPQPAITETEEGFSPGDDIDIAVAELFEEKSVDKYKIGFIAEKVEEIYSLKSGKLVGTKKDTDVFHLEAIIRDASTGKIVPHADAVMQLTNKETGENKVYNLVPMWSEFFHYASNADISPGIWDVTVLVRPPALGYLEADDVFDESSSAKFTFDTSRVLDGEDTQNTGGFEQIRSKIYEAVTEYKEGDNEKASNLARDAFIIFEEEIGSEIGAKSPSLEDKIESEILSLSGLMKSSAPLGQIEAKTELISKLLDEAKVLLEEKPNSLFLFFQSVIIIVREGFEAMIIIAAIIAYLTVSKNTDKKKTIYYATCLAIIASFLTAWLIEQVFKFEIASQEILEGVTMLIAVVVLFYVSYWLISKVQAEKWQKFIEGKVKDAITAGNQFVLGAIAFLAVYREGFETVLFYKALSIEAPGGTLNIIVGFITGILALAVIYWIFYKYSIKMPVKQFFIGTSAILYFMSFTFMGNGIHELQEGGAISITSLTWAPNFPLLGIFPTLETVIAQICLVIALVLMLIFVFWQYTWIKSEKL